jgi:hypothetical protein
MNRPASSLPPSGPGQTRRPAAKSAGAASGALVGSTFALVIVVSALALAAYALLRQDAWGERNTAVPERFRLNLGEQMRIAPELISHVERAWFDISLSEPRALAVDTGGTIYVAGDQAVEWFDPHGRPTGRVALDQPPTCLAVASADTPADTRIYVASRRQVTVLDGRGERINQWPPWDAPTLVTALAVTPNGLLVADAGRRVVLRCDQDGRELDRIGQPDPDRNMPGFVIPSAHFDLVAGSDGTVLVVNPGMRRVETYSLEGELQSYWGQAGSTIEDFFGCCNPARLARLRDGRLVTSEKGIPRVKIYSEHGDFESVVAGPEALGVSESGLGDARGNLAERIFPVAVGPRDEVLVVDAFHGCIRRFEARESESGERL